VKLLLQPLALGSQLRVENWRNGCVSVGCLPVVIGSAGSPFIIGNAIVGLAQPLTEALNQLASGPRRTAI